MTDDALFTLLSSAPDEAAPRRLFLWQRRLLRLLESGQPPETVAVPTGLGKTSVMLLWLMALAKGAPLPRRLVHVVGRGTVVDHATDVAITLRRALRKPEAAGLRDALGLDADGLAITTLRGPHADDCAWMENPAAPAVIVGAPDMIGSRLLFSGHEVSPRLRPVQAGLLAVDTLFLVDDAHLSQPFEAMVREVAACTGAMRVMALKATPAPTDDAFRLSPDEAADAPVARRLHAAKTLTLVPASAQDAVEPFVDHALALARRRPGARVLVCRDDHDDALSIADALRAAHGTAGAVAVLAGRRRGFERDALAQTLAERGFLGGGGTRDSGPFFVVASRAGEVGVDLHADDMVCDLVGWERMALRLGRVNRRGLAAASVRVIDPDASGSKGRHGEEPRLAATRRLLAALPRIDPADRARDASPAALDALADHPDMADAPISPPPHPPLDQPTIEMWSMTSLSHHGGRPDVTPWVRGWDEAADPETTIVWRRRLPVSADAWDGHAPDDPTLRTLLAQRPPQVAERLQTRCAQATDWIVARACALAGTVRPDEPILISLRDAAEAPTTLTLAAATDAGRVARAIAGATVLVAAKFAGLNSDGFLDPAASSPPRTVDDDTQLAACLPWADIAIGAGAPAPAAANLAAFRRRRPRTDPPCIEQPCIQTSGGRAATVVERVTAFAERVGLPEALRLALVLAARWSEDGDSVNTWRRAGAQKDCRRAVLSATVAGPRTAPHRWTAATASADPPGDLRDLALHLMASRDGCARPLRPVGYGDAAAPLGHGQGHSRDRDDAALRFARLQAAHGPWGLAYLEAFLRAAGRGAPAAADRAQFGG